MDIFKEMQQTGMSDRHFKEMYDRNVLKWQALGYGVLHVCHKFSSVNIEFCNVAL